MTHLVTLYLSTTFDFASSSCACQRVFCYLCFPFPTGRTSYKKTAGGAGNSKGGPEYPERGCTAWGRITAASSTKTERGDEEDTCWFPLLSPQSTCYTEERHTQDVQCITIVPFLCYFMCSAWVTFSLATEIHWYAEQTYKTRKHFRIIACFSSVFVKCLLQEWSSPAHSL